jgi:HAMP domain-containing protein
MLLLILIIAMLIIVAVTHFYIKRETESLKKLVALTDDMAKGKYDSPMPDIETDDEIGLLRDSLENLQYSLSAKSK